jgi:hypothetical protein
MLRKRAVRSLLVERIAGLRPSEGGETGELDDDALDRAERYVLDQARRKARAMAFLALGALVVLFLTRPTAERFLPLDATFDTVFTLGVLAVAVFAGYRLGTLEKLSAVKKVHEETR